jgi:hypothetical protein
VKAEAHAFDGPVAEILGRLEEAQASDGLAEKQTKRYSNWFVGCLVFGLIGWLPLAFVGTALDTSTPILLSPLSLVAAVVFRVLQVLARRHDVDDRRLETAARLLRMLGADTAEGASAELKLDLRGYLKAGRLVEKQGGFFSSVKTWKSSFPWLQLTGALVDGTRYQIGVVDTIGRKTKSKRKYKKVKERFRSQIVLKLRLRPRAGAVEPIVAALEAAEPPSPLSRVAVKGSGQLLEVRLATPPAVQTKGRYRTTPADPARLVSGDQLLSALLWTWDGIGRSLQKTA